MELRIAVAGDPLGIAGRSLRSLLAENDEIRGSRVSSVAVPGDPEAMGGVAEVLLVALGSGGAVAAAVHSVLGWLRCQGPKVKVTITAEGVSAEVEAATLKQAQEAAAIVAAFQVAFGEETS